MCSNLKKFDSRWNRWTVKHESMFEVALVFFVYKRIVWNPCSRDPPFGQEDCVDINPWVTCISILVLLDFCSKVNSCSLSVLLTACKPLDNSVVVFAVYVFTLFSLFCPLWVHLNSSTNTVSPFPSFLDWKKTVQLFGEAPYWNMTFFISCALMIKMQ